MARTIQTAHLLRCAASLLSDTTSEGDSQNPEYDRALIELVGDMMGLAHDSEDVCDAIEHMLRAL